MKITLITVGKIKEKYLKDAIAEYSKRLSRYCKLEIIEVALYVYLLSGGRDGRGKYTEQRRRADPEVYPGRYVCDHAGDRRKDALIRRTDTEDRDFGYTGREQYRVCHRRIHRTWKGSPETFRLCAELLKNDISPSADAGDSAGAGVPELSDHEWRAIS